MKREILFRGKRVEEKDWVTGSFVDVTGLNGDTYAQIEIANANEHRVYHVAPDSVGQLLFKNSRDRFFEGDHVSYIIPVDGEVYKKGEEFLSGFLQQTERGIRVVKMVSGGFTAVYLSERTMIGELDLECFRLTGNIHDFAAGALTNNKTKQQ